MPRTSRITENVYAVEAQVLSQGDRPGTDTPTEQFLKYPEKLTFRDGFDVIIFSE